MRQLKTTVGLLSVAGLFLPGALEAASCTATARYVGAEPKDDRGWKQAITIAVSADKAGHGLVNYTVAYQDKAGASFTEASNESYKFVPSAATASSGGGGASGGSTVVSDDTYVSLKPYTVTGATIKDVTCRTPKAKCTATATYASSADGSKKGWAKVNFNLVSADCGGSCTGAVTYTLAYKDSAGAEQTKSGIYTYTVSGTGGGGGAPEVQVVDEALLASKNCPKGGMCKVTGVTIDKVSCFAD
jgi:hypothetical protein